MPTTSVVYPSHRLVVTSCSEGVTLDEVRTSAAQIRDHPEFRPHFRQLIDLNRATRIHLHFKELYELKHVHDPFSNESKRAVVAATDASYGVSRMYQLILNTPYFEVFRSLPQAAQWLEVDLSFLENELHSTR